MGNKTTYCVYLLECRDGSYYCGITTDMQQRLEQHNAGSASRYTRARRPVKLLVQSPNCYSRSEALKLEHKIKKCPRHKKPRMMALVIMQGGEDQIP